MTNFFEDGLAELELSYPEAPARLRHDLAEHPLLRPDALIGLASRMREADQQCYRGDVSVGVGAEGTPRNGLDAAATIRSLENGNSWMVLKNIEQDPVYENLLDALLDDVKKYVVPATGEMLMREAFIFASSPHAVTPFHIDPEHNILLQISGCKEMTVFSQHDRQLASQEAHERYYNTGDYTLDWHEEYRQRGAAHVLEPGDALYVPVKAPHFVRNGDKPSISLSITWRSAWSFAEADAHGFNALVRRLGLRPAAPSPFPQTNSAKAYAFRAMRKVGLTD